MKDRFSGHAADYAKFRPSYPQELVAYLVSLAPAHHLAWDCATGNGQVAGQLAEYFAAVVGTDISGNQLRNAVQKPNITYKVEQAEQASFANSSVDLVVVAQAVHWFEFELFYQQVKRVLRPEAIIAIIGYGLLKTGSALDETIERLYSQTLNKYWDFERNYIDENYRTIPFPFKELDAPRFAINYSWTIEGLLGYLNTWSAVKNYQNENNHNPVAMLEQELRDEWGQQEKISITFDIITRIGKV